MSLRLSDKVWYEQPRKSFACQETRSKRAREEGALTPSLNLAVPPCRRVAASFQTSHSYSTTPCHQVPTSSGPPDDSRDGVRHPTATSSRPPDDSRGSVRRAAASGSGPPDDSRDSVRHPTVTGSRPPDDSRGGLRLSAVADVPAAAPQDPVSSPFIVPVVSPHMAALGWGSPALRQHQSFQVFPPHMQQAPSPRAVLASGMSDQRAGAEGGWTNEGMRSSLLMFALSSPLPRPCDAPWLCHCTYGITAGYRQVEV